MGVTMRLRTGVGTVMRLLQGHVVRHVVGVHVRERPGRVLHGPTTGAGLHPDQARPGETAADQ